MPGGTIMGLDKSFGGPNTFEGMKIVQRDWNDQTLWSFTSWDKLGDNGLISRQHHDLQREGDPVGYYSPDQTPLAAGRTLVLSHKDVKQPKIASTTIMDDVIYEVDAAGKLTNFTWYASDHVEEMGFDKVARAAMASNPGKSQNDWLHLNSMATLGKNRHYDKTGDERFNPDNIIINSREASFIAIINRATGKIVWRLGPNFKAPWSQKVGPIVAAHHAHMIPKGLPGAGNILVFDNGGAAGYGGANGGYLHERSYTRVLEFDPITLKVVWSYGAASGPEHFICGAQGSAQRLPNGNTLITQADSGRFFEVLPTRETVWEGITRDHFIGLNMPYRVYRVPPEWLPAGVKASGYKAWSNGGCK